jgi:hypothetical protein
MPTLWKYRRSQLVSIVAMFFAIGEVAAAENRYTTPSGILIIDVDSNWSEMSSLPDGLEGIGFELDDGRMMQFMLGTHEELPPGAADAGTLRQLTNDLRRSDEAENLEVSEDLMSLSGPNFTGYYYLATNPAAMPAPGDYKFMYTGFIAVGSDPMMFIIAWNAGGKSAADRALASLKRLRVDRR